ncbi:hypothetical protein GCM10028822_36490 [Hymenobacter terrigena]
MVAGQQQRPGQVQALGVAHLDAAEKDPQRNLHQRFHHSIKKHGREYGVWLRKIGPRCPQTPSAAKPGGLAALVPWE